MNVKEKMSLLSLLAYYDFANPNRENLQKNVKNILEHDYKSDLEISEVSWGPIGSTGIKVSCALMFVVKHRDNGGGIPEYTIVIRGTNPISVYSWLCLDMKVTEQISWSEVLKQINPITQEPKNIPENALISKGTFTALKTQVSELIDENSLTVLDWILLTIKPKNESPKKIKINITGHSLGGLLTTTLALWLNYKITERKLDDFVDLNIYSFAAPTAGNQEFVKHTEKVFQDKFKEHFKEKFICYANKLDVATHAWVESDMKKLNTIYINKEKGDELKPSSNEEIVLKAVQALSENKGYHKLSITPIESKIEYYILSPLCGTTYSIEAIYQHISPYFRFSVGLNLKIILGIIYDILRYIIQNCTYHDALGNKVEVTITKEEIEKLYLFISEEMSNTTK